MQNPLPPVLPIRPFTRPANAVVSVPGSKSITNRALALAAILPAKEDKKKKAAFEFKEVQTLQLSQFLQSRDKEVMIAALKTLGTEIEEFPTGWISTDGERTGSVETLTIPFREKTERFHELSSGRTEEVSLPVFRVKRATINVGNAGTAARFLTAILCLSDGGEYEIVGDEAMELRPMKGLTDALASLGAEFDFHKTSGCVPFTVKTHSINGNKVQVDASESSQILSALLIMAAGVGRQFTVELLGNTVSEPFVEMTIQMLRQFGASVVVDGRKFIVSGSLELSSTVYVVEPDATAASYFLMLPGVAGGETFIARLGACNLQGDIAFTHVLQRVGVRTVAQLGSKAKEVVATAGQSLRGVTADFNDFSDTFLTLAAVSPLLTGTTRIEGIGHTRKQETDRVHAAYIELHDKLGQNVIEEPDALEIHPNLDALKKLALEARERGAKGEGSGCIEIDTHEDHRFAMSFAILGCRDLLGDGKPWLAIKDPACCKKTFPNFFDVLEDAWNQSHK